MENKEEEILLCAFCTKQALIENIIKGRTIMLCLTCHMALEEAKNK